MMHQTHHPTVEFRRKMIAQQLETTRKSTSQRKIWWNGAVTGFLFGLIVGMFVLAQVI